MRKAAVVHPGQDFIKRVIAELGGKNAIIVDGDADLDEAVAGCCNQPSATRARSARLLRVVVLEENYPRFISRLVPAAEALTIGDPADCASDLGPVIDHAAKRRIEEFVALGKREHNLLLEKPAPAGGADAPLVIFDQVNPDAVLAQEEIFGPVLSVIKVKDMDEALKVANGVSYALTGGLYSRSPLNIARVRREFRVGNLYLNRGCTGAMVGRQAFGGFKLSGIGSKSGGPDYLLQFMEPRCVTENTLRRGFAPAEAD